MVAAAALLAGFDLFFILVAIANRGRVFVTHVGLDSASYMAPIDRKAATFQQKRWQPTLDDTKIESVRSDFVLVPVDYVSLSPAPSYGQFLAIVHHLKRRGRCNVLVQCPEIRIVKPDSAELGMDPVFDVPALVFCGEALGDAGISDPIADDGFVFVPREKFGGRR